MSLKRPTPQRWPERPALDLTMDEQVDPITHGNDDCSQPIEWCSRAVELSPAWFDTTVPISTACFACATPRTPAATPPTSDDPSQWLPGGLSRRVATNSHRASRRSTVDQSVDRRGKIRKTLIKTRYYGGEGGIRTHDTLASMPHFECGAFNHSATSPSLTKWALLCDLFVSAPIFRDYPG